MSCVGKLFFSPFFRHGMILSLQRGAFCYSHCDVPSMWHESPYTQAAATFRSMIDVLSCSAPLGSLHLELCVDVLRRQSGNPAFADMAEHDFHVSSQTILPETSGLPCSRQNVHFFGHESVCGAHVGCSVFTWTILMSRLVWCEPVGPCQGSSQHELAIRSQASVATCQGHLVQLIHVEVFQQSVCKLLSRQAAEVGLPNATAATLCASCSWGEEREVKRVDLCSCCGQFNLEVCCLQTPLFPETTWRTDQAPKHLEHSACCGQALHRLRQPFSGKIPMATSRRRSHGWSAGVQASHASLTGVLSDRSSDPGVTVCMVSRLSQNCLHNQDAQICIAKILATLIHTIIRI